MPRLLFLALTACMLASFICVSLPAQEAAAPPTPEDVANEVLAASTTTPAATHPPELTLWVMIENGGVILWVIIALSVFALVLGIYLFMTVTVNRESPQGFVKHAMKQLAEGDLRDAWRLCEGRDELIANILRAGLKVAAHDRFVIQEAMEGEGERGASILWQRISYMNNVGNIAPLLGLLGTVWGMIGAFGAIAFDDASVKSLTMAYNVSMAMITTAAGLMLAIPAMLAYFYLRGRVIKILAEVEAQASEMVELIVRSRPS